MNVKMFLGAALTALVLAFMACNMGDLPETGNSLDNDRFVAVQSITGMTEYGKVGSSLALTGTVQPANATNKVIVWEVTDNGATGAVVNGSTLTATATGTVALRATIANGKAAGMAYTKDFTVALGTDITDVQEATGNSLADQLAWVKANAESGGVYILTAYDDESLAPQTLAYDDKTGIVLRLGSEGADKTVSFSPSSYGAKALFVVEDGVTLVLGNVTLRGKSSNTSNAPVVLIRSGGTLIMNGGKITGNRFAYGYDGISLYGCGVYVEGTFIMNGGKISDNTIPIYDLRGNSGGAGVHVQGGTFTMNGGEISGNTLSSTHSRNNNYGAGVRVLEGTFTMNGGEISGNTIEKSGSGGGVYVGEGGTFTLKSGKISGNTVAGWGGGVGGYNFTMDGGEISGNTSSNYGGGVNVPNFTMNGGVISGNTGIGGVMATGTFTMNGGVISDHHNINGSGGGVLIGWGEEDNFIMNGGKIFGNTTTGSGGGVNNHNTNGTFTMNGGEISGNTAAKDGGGVCGLSIMMTGGEISGNTAVNNGGGVNGGIIKIGGTISGNASSVGNTVYHSSNRIRERAAGPGDNLDSNKYGVAGGWDN